MKYAILRTQKLKAAVAVHRSLKHAFREQDTPNADAKLTHENTHIGAQSAAEGMAAFRAALPDKIRKNAVMAIEYLMTASPEAMDGKTREQQDAFFADSLEWLRERHGAENVVYAGIHRDEKTPHMYAYVVPKDPDTGRLNCRRFLGGAKALSEMQTDFAEQVGKRHGLERGIEGSKAKHQRVSQFYAQINKTPDTPTVTEQDIEPRQYKRQGIAEKLHLSTRYEAPEAVAERLNAQIRKATQPLAENAAVAVQERRRAAEMSKTAQTLQERLKTTEKALERFTDGLDREDVAELVVQAHTLRIRKQERQEQEKRVNALPTLAKRAVGAVRIFAEKALDAIRKAGGKWQDVRWGTVEDDTKQTAIEQGVTRYSTAKAIMEHSPGQAHLSPEMRRLTLDKIADRYPQEAAKVKQEQQAQKRPQRGISR